MSVIESPHHDSSTPSKDVTSRSVIKGLVIVGGILALAMMLLTPIAGIFLLRSSDSTTTSSTNEVVETGSETLPVSNDAGDKYFGEVNIGQGSTVNFAVTGGSIRSAKDVEVVAMPDSKGLIASVLDGDGASAQFELEVSNDFPVGPHTMNFRITGEPEVVVWVFTVLPR